MATLRYVLYYSHHNFSSNDKLISSHYLCLPLNVLPSVHFKFTSQPKFTSPGFPLIERPLQGYNTWRTAELRLLWEGTRHCRTAPWKRKALAWWGGQKHVRMFKRYWGDGKQIWVYWKWLLWASLSIPGQRTCDRDSRGVMRSKGSLVLSVQTWRQVAARAIKIQK